jgi:hypothetical protein
LCDYLFVNLQVKFVALPQPNAPEVVKGFCNKLSKSFIPILNALSEVLEFAVALKVKFNVVFANTVGAVPVIAPVDEFKVKLFVDKTVRWTIYNLKIRTCVIFS